MKKEAPLLCGVWKCVCCTTAFFLSSSSGRFNHTFYLTCNSIIKTKFCRNLLNLKIKSIFIFFTIRIVTELVKDKQETAFFPFTK